MQRDYVLALDLGTGGLKSSVVDSCGAVVCSQFSSYKTYFPAPNLHEQRPSEWWESVVVTLNQLKEKVSDLKERLAAISISGHSLGGVPVGSDGELLTEYTPIWSDKRAEEEAKAFFENVDYEEWYGRTGNGFPPECYTLFKILWLKRHYPEIYCKADTFLGTKDYINFLLTGVKCTDYSYASGSGLFDLSEWSYHMPTVEVAGIDANKLPQLKRSSEVIGVVKEQVAELLGMGNGVKVVAGGVDNSCMALGARCYKSGRVYTSLGSSAWVALTSTTPIVDAKYKPYVFAHVIEGLYTSATAIFSAGNSFRWVRDTLATEEVAEERRGGIDAYLALTELARRSPRGANRTLFNPSLAGGSMLEESPDICGGFAGLQLSTTKADMIRATLEGIAINLSISLEVLMNYYPDIEEMLIVGGGAKSELWMQIFAECYKMPVKLSTINQEAASLGAAALAFVGCGLWDDYSAIDKICRVERTILPEEEGIAIYSKQRKLFRELAHFMSEMGRSLKE